MKYIKGKTGVWLFRGLVALAAIFLLISAIMPWWICDITVPVTEGRTTHVKIFGYGLRHNMTALRDYVAADETPLYLSVLAWIYIAASLALMFWSTYVRGIKGRLLLGSVGLTYIIYAVVAIFMVTASRIQDFGISLLGWSNMIYKTSVEIVVTFYGELQPGYYLCYVAGEMCILLAVLRNIIVAEH